MTTVSEGNDDLFLPQRFLWMRRAMFSGLPTEPKTGDLGSVKDAVAEIVDAAGGLEHARHQVGGAMAVAQDEFDAAVKGLPDLLRSDSWGGRNTPVVYYGFCSAVAWTRAVKDRYMDRLRPSVKHDSALWTTLQRVRSRADAQFEDARLLAQCALHKYTPPYPLAGPKVGKGGILIYRVPKITDPDDFRANLSSLADDRHVASLVDEWWSAVTQFVDGLLEVFYPQENMK